VLSRDAALPEPPDTMADTRPAPYAANHARAGGASRCGRIDWLPNGRMALLRDARSLRRVGTGFTSSRRVGGRRSEESSKNALACGAHVYNLGRVLGPATSWPRLGASMDSEYACSRKTEERLAQPSSNAKLGNWMSGHRTC